MSEMFNKLKGKCRHWASPFLTATPKQRLKWLCLTVIFSAVAVGVEVWFYDNYRIGWDRQTIRCLDSRFFLVDLKDKELKRDQVYAYTSIQAHPVIPKGEMMGKYLRGMPGDLVEIRDDYSIWINKKKIAQGMPHLKGMSQEQMKKFIGSRILKDDEYWMMGTNFLSFDSRYWGPIHKDQIIARSYVLF